MSGDFACPAPSCGKSFATGAGVQGHSWVHGKAGYPTPARSHKATATSEPKDEAESSEMEYAPCSVCGYEWRDDEPEGTECPRCVEKERKATETKDKEAPKLETVKTGEPAVKVAAPRAEPTEAQKRNRTIALAVVGIIGVCVFIGWAIHSHPNAFSSFASKLKGADKEPPEPEQETLAQSNSPYGSKFQSISG
jgi:hypothetical protein